jgi:hypothetical protein
MLIAHEKTDNLGTLIIMYHLCSNLLISYS